MTQMTEENAKQLGMTSLEWRRILEELNRVPSHEELQMLGVMWSEHCSYKSSKWALKQLRVEGPHILQGPGENAGLVALDEDRAVAFKVESHNHPSYVEPFQGAATGVGGILRDIFTMGARPVATGNFLRFGNLNSRKQQYLLNGVISGISHYGNCVGIPNVCGQIHADASYENNILVNVLAVGVADRKKIFKSNSAKPGHSVMIWGALTGRDGIHGASLLASADFTVGEQASKSSTQEQKIRVQVGDPFKEKCLMEACLEAMESCAEDLLAIQDMGAAGLTCSTMEISAKSGVGMRIDLDRVPVREEQMQAFELLLSESQERMLAVVRKGSEEKFKRLLERWQCAAETIGETTGDGLLKMTYQGEQVVNMPVERLMDPPPADLPAVSEMTQGAPRPSDFSVEDVREEWRVLRRILQEPRIASKASVYGRYDSTVGAATVFGPGQEAAVLWLGTEKHPHLGIGIKGAWDEAYARFNPRLATHHAMAECVRALACVGAKALAVTDGVNLGNPKEENVQRALIDIVHGMNDAIDVFGTPCIGGNVSLYNQTQIQSESGVVKQNIEPTVFMAMVGTIEDVRRSVPSSFQKAGHEVWLLEAPGNPQQLPYGSVYSRLFWPEHPEVIPWIDLQAEKKLQGALLAAHERGLFVSCRDITDGGMATALAEACFEKRLGFDGDLSKWTGRRDFHLFHESGGRVVVEIDPARRSELVKFGMEYRLDCKRLGHVTEETVFRLRPLMVGAVDELFESWSGVFV